MSGAPGGRGQRGRRRSRDNQPPALKRFGQHFLTDKRILTEIVDALAPTPSDTVVEIGPGRGIRVRRARTPLSLTVATRRCSQVREAPSAAR